MTEKEKAYIISNHDKYGIHNEQGKLLSKQEMFELLEILDLFDENLDSFHDVQNQGYTEFCGIYGTFDSDDDTYKAIVNFHNYRKQSELNQFFNDILDNYTYDTETEEQSVDDFKHYFEFMYLDDLDIVKGGLVHHIYC